jgi:hypothetical protein
MLDAGCWILDTGYSILDTRYWILDTGYSILDTRCWMLDAGRLLRKGIGYKVEGKANSSYLTPIPLFACGYIILPLYLRIPD